MLKKCVAIVGTVAMLTTLPGLVGTASADHLELVFGAGIRLGGLHLAIALNPRAHRYYYRTADRLGYDHYRCNDRCYRRGGYIYHDQSCPVVLHLLYSRGVHPHDLYTRYAPYYDGRFSRYDPYYYERVNYVGGRYYDDGYGRDRYYGRDRGLDRRAYERDRRYERQRYGRERYRDRRSAPRRAPRTGGHHRRDRSHGRRRH